MPVIKSISKGVGLAVAAVGGLAAVAGALAGLVLWSSLPDLDGEVGQGLCEAPVEAYSDEFGVPTVVAASRGDALRALGYLVARDRLFQMDMLRRRSAGRLAEVVGKSALKVDKKQRVWGFDAVAGRVLGRLPESQREALRDYARGVNAYIAEADALPFEFHVLGYEPEPWREEDSVLIVLYMFQMLYGKEGAERTVTVMEEALPGEVVSFLTPDTDRYATALLGGGQSRRPVQSLPTKALGAVMRDHKDRRVAQHWSLEDGGFTSGSNGWALGGARTADGGAILANDMHLALTVPNIWYRAALRYGASEVVGYLLPGVPAVIAGSNDYVAWGVTSTAGDFLDLVRLDINPDNPLEYRTPGGWTEFETKRERIGVKGGEAVEVDVEWTVWGPVSPQTLMGGKVAVRWSALDPDAVDIGMLDMYQARTIEEAIGVMNRASGPPVNVLLADRGGRIAWTLSGKYPVRDGFDGIASRHWHGGGVGWRGYVDPDSLPQLVDPPSGYIATSNNRTLGRDHPLVIGYNFVNGYRAHRIAQVLRATVGADEQDMLALQLDTRSAFYDFYRDLIVDLVGRGEGGASPLALEALECVEGWNGRADADQAAFGLLVQYRKDLVKGVFEPVVAAGRDRDPRFAYAWRNKEPPLRLILSAGGANGLPAPDGFDTWDLYLLAKLEDSVRHLLAAHGVASLSQLEWGSINRSRFRHPLSKALPFLAGSLDMPKGEMSGCGFCVANLGATWGASERLVISPGRHGRGLCHTPGGQSGHPLSAHYRDQYGYWLRGEGLPCSPGPSERVLRFGGNT